MSVIQLPAIASDPELEQAFSLRWFRNGIGPPADGMRRLGEALDAVMGLRTRCLYARPQNYDPSGDFDSGTSADIVVSRFAVHTGPVTTKARARFCFLPVKGATPASPAYAQWVTTTGLSGSGTATSLARVYTPYATASGNLYASELFESEIAFALSPDTDYRFELHLVNKCRLVSCSVFEEPRSALDTDTDANAVEINGYVQGGPIRNDQVNDLITAADLIWRNGHPLFWWSHDLPGDVVTRVSATPANHFDQTVTAATTTTRGFPISVPYSGSLDSSNVPVVMWCYASVAAGTGTVTYKDQGNATIGTINVTSSTADWYWTTGNLTDATLGADTSKVDVLIAGTGAAAISVYAFGCFMRATADANLSAVVPLSWMPHFPDQIRRRRTPLEPGRTLRKPLP